MKDLIVAIGLLLALEGAVYAAMPGVMKRVMREAMSQPEGVIRWVGFAALVIGVCLVWLIRG